MELVARTRGRSLTALVGRIRGPPSLLRNVANSGVPDGVHPTGDGYRVLASAIAQAILAGGLPHRRIACLGDSITNGQHVPGAGTAEGETYPAWLARILA
jgi:lysophospholipase L1-like esterase